MACCRVSEEQLLKVVLHMLSHKRETQRGTKEKRLCQPSNLVVLGFYAWGQVDPAGICRYWNFVA